ncbi:MAG: shikimate kinase [Coriobacteriia bacterium]|nr:shikimate kinase [Coriobacteriia bacterium]
MDGKRHIALVGFMGAGKSSVALELARRNANDCLDLDEMIEIGTGKTVAAVFATDGERLFRELELQALRDALARPQTAVIACGGGTVTNPESYAALREQAVVVYLQIETDRALLRIDDWSSRPMLTLAGGSDAVYQLARSRFALYETLADLSVCTDKLTIERVAENIEAKLKEAGYARLLA